jgi:hypothetical protein
MRLEGASETETASHFRYPCFSIAAQHHLHYTKGHPNNSMATRKMGDISTLSRYLWAFGAPLAHQTVGTVQTQRRSTTDSNGRVQYGQRDPLSARTTTQTSFFIFRQPHKTQHHTCCDEALDIQSITKADVPDRTLYSRCFALPVSTTYRMFGIVRDVSATFVATTMSRCPAGGG